MVKIFTEASEKNVFYDGVFIGKIKLVHDKSGLYYWNSVLMKKINHVWHREHIVLGKPKTEEEAVSLLITAHESGTFFKDDE